MTVNASTPTSPTQDERIMAALSHISVLLPFWGIIAPIIIWATQREKSAYVRFQALQALAYQLVMILGGFISFGCYMLSIFGMMFTIPFASDTFGPSTSPPEWLFFLFPGFPFCIFGAMFVFGFLFIAYGIVGAIMALQGNNFRYAIIGTRIERFLQRG